MSKRSFWFVLPVALFTACSSSPQGDDGPDGPLGALPDALTDSSTGPTAIPGSSTEVWSVSNQWADTSTAAASEKGIAWDANSGLSWEQKFGKWLSSFDKIRNSSDSGDTIQVKTPYGGKVVPGAALECAETAMTLRALFSSWYHLPFYLTGWDDKAKKPLYAGHFGFVNGSGEGISGFPRFKDQYQDKEPGWQAGQDWPKDSKLRTMHLADNDSNDFLEPGAGAGAWFDEVTLNKRVGYFLRLLLLEFGSVNLADGANMFHIQPEATTPGDVLLERWQKNGIGHTIPVFRVDTVNGKPAPTVATGSMPRRQALWAEPIDGRHYFTSDETGGEGTASDGTPYAKLGGGIRRWRIAVQSGGKWSNTVAPVDQPAFIASSNVAAISARPKKFDQILAFGTPQDRKTAALQMIDAARTKLHDLPASCSSRTLREDGFRILYNALSELEQKDQDTVDKQYRKLEDYVFGELDYSKSKTCCWNTTTPAMANIILDFAKAEQDKATANNQCVQPTVFHAVGADDGYDKWRQFATSTNRAGDWRAWSEDEPCTQRAVPEDATTWRDNTNYCSIPRHPAAGADRRRGSPLNRLALALAALLSGALACSAAPDDGGAEGASADTASAPLHDRAFYEKIARDAGLDPSAATLVVGLRGVSRTGAFHDVRSLQVYDDVLAVLRPDGTVTELAASTHPWFTTSTLSPDVNGDGKRDVGMIRPGVYHAEPRPGRTIVGQPTFHIVNPNGQDGLSGWRDTNHDGVFDEAERAASVQRNDKLDAVLFHEAGPAAPAPIGCQVLDAKGIKIFVDAVGGANARFSYVLVDAPRTSAGG